MATIALVAQRTFPYAGQSIVAGQCFDALSEPDAAVLKAIGHAVDAPAEAPPEEIVVPVHHNINAGGSVDFADDPPLTIPQKRTYRRRVAEAE